MTARCSDKQAAVLRRFGLPDDVSSRRGTDWIADLAANQWALTAELQAIAAEHRPTVLAAGLTYARRVFADKRADYPELVTDDLLQQLEVRIQRSWKRDPLCSKAQLFEVADRLVRKWFGTSEDRDAEWGWGGPDQH